MFKPKVRKRFIRIYHRYYSDPYIDNYINMECPACRELIHYGYTVCPKCGTEIDQEHPEVKAARKRYIVDAAVALALGVIYIVIAVIIVLGFYLLGIQ